MTMTARQRKNWSKARKDRFRSRQKKTRACRATQPSVKGDRVELFTSKAHYFDNRPPVSWDVAMFTTGPDWRVEVKAGDTLELQTTYETKIASWYESMGLQVVYMADADAGTSGRNPYEKKVSYRGAINHGQLEENSDHGGTGPVVGPDPRKLPSGLLTSGPLMIGGYSYEAGDFRIPGATGRPPVVEKGDQMTFELSASDQTNQIWHSLTSCKAPCNRSTGISYPIPDGEFQFDSGQLGMGEAPTVNRSTWSTPRNMPVGTHTFFCRIHPLMRGAVRVVKPK
jgi:plastocyanin